MASVGTGSSVTDVGDPRLCLHSSAARRYWNQAFFEYIAVDAEGITYTPG